MPWGSEAFGAGPWGDGVVGSFFLVSGETIRENMVRLTFSEPPHYSLWHDPGDASVLSNYSIQKIHWSIGIDGQLARTVAPAKVMATDFDPFSVDLWTDRAMTAFGAFYLVAVTGIKSNAGHWLASGDQSVIVNGMQMGMAVALLDQAASTRDIANPQVGSALLDPMASAVDARLLGSYSADHTGDIARDEGLTSYQKRVYRRLITRKDSFAHLRGYGTNFVKSVQTLARHGVAQALCADAEQQVRQEPETVDCSVRLMQDSRNVFWYQVRAKTRFGNGVPVNAPVGVTEDLSA
jgi:hypothetical protein